MGPVTYLAIGKEKDSSKKIELLSKIVPVYVELLNALAAEEVARCEECRRILVRG